MNATQTRVFDALNAASRSLFFTTDDLAMSEVLVTSLELDELEIWGLLIELERTLEVEISDEEFDDLLLERCATVQEIVDFLASKL